MYTNQMFYIQIEGITSTWKERKRSGGEYSKRHASGRRHVVVCSSNLMSETMMDFLMEFYAHPKLEVREKLFFKEIEFPKTFNE